MIQIQTIVINFAHNHQTGIQKISVGNAYCNKGKSPRLLILCPYFLSCAVLGHALGMPMENFKCQEE